MTRPERCLVRRGECNHYAEARDVAMTLVEHATGVTL